MQFEMLLFFWVLCRKLSIVNRNKISSNEKSLTEMSCALFGVLSVFVRQRSKESRRLPRYSLPQVLIKAKNSPYEVKLRHL